MSLTPLRPPKKRERRICAYDMEWVPQALTVRLVGFVDDDGEGRRGKYRAFTGEGAVRDFLDFVLTPKYAGAYIYAHAGGLADGQFLLEELVSRRSADFDVQAIFSGSSAVILKVRRGGKVWTFCDSYWTLPEALKRIGERLGMPKGEVEWTAPLQKLIPYNEQDCRILQEALLRYQDAIVSMGSEMSSTNASTALRLFRRKYLSRPIQTDARLNHEIREAYAGGRVECFYDRWHSGHYYDVNSCYVWAMTNSLPGTKVGTGTRLPHGDQHAYVARLTVNVPKTMALPPLPYTLNPARGLYFPTGRWTSWFCGPEVELAESLGVEIERVHKVHVFELRDDLKHFAEGVFAKRLAARGTYEEQVYKNTGNGCYGKFAEERLKQGLVLHPRREKLEEIRDKAHAFRERQVERGVEAYPFDPYVTTRGEWEHVPPVERVQPGVFLTREPVKVPHAHVAIAAYVTSYARVRLYHHMARTDARYCDTDGFGCTDPDIPVSTALGDLKLEKTYEGVFHSPKLYRMLLPDGAEIVKAKGFSRSIYYEDERVAVLETDRRLLAEGARAVEEDLTGTPREVTDLVRDRSVPHALDGRGFELLTGGEDVWVRRMRRIRELYARGRTRPEVIDERKGLRGARTKRKFQADGSSVPWDVDEL